MGYYDKGYTLCEYFANLDENAFNEFVKSTNGFGSTFLHEAVGQNNVKLLQNIFENQDNQVLFVLKDYSLGLMHVGNRSIPNQILSLFLYSISSVPGEKRQSVYWKQQIISRTHPCPR